MRTYLEAFLNALGLHPNSAERLEEVPLETDLIIMDAIGETREVKADIAYLRSIVGKPDLPFVLLKSLSRNASDKKEIKIPRSWVKVKPLRRLPLRHTLEEILSEVAPVSEQEAASETPTESLRILIAEDDPINQIVARHILQDVASILRTATNGEEALRMYAAEPFDLIFMDCQMPLMDGYEATRRIRWIEAEGADRVPIVALTANAMEADRQACLAAGMNDFLSKPITRAEVNEVIRRVLSADSKD
ncbi:hypothetical protein BH11ARM2_BH11ARM2_32390 [soil metagenome]